MGHNQKLNDIKNFDEKVDNIKEVLSKWDKRDLSLFGKIQIIKTFTISKLVLPAIHNVCQSTLSKELKRFSASFCGNEKIRLSKLK